MNYSGLDIIGTQDPFDELWDERRSSPDYDYEDDDMPDYDEMEDRDYE